MDWQSFELKVVVRGKKTNSRMSFWKKNNYNQQLKMTIKVGEK